MFPFSHLQQQEQPVVTSLSLLRTMYDMCRTATASMGLRDLLSVSVRFIVIAF